MQPAPALALQPKLMLHPLQPSLAVVAAGHKCQAQPFDHPASVVAVSHHTPHAPGHPDLHHSNKCFIHGWQNRIIFQILNLLVKKNPSQCAAGHCGLSWAEPDKGQLLSASLRLPCFSHHVGEHSGAACT